MKHAILMAMLLAASGCGGEDTSGGTGGGNEIVRGPRKIPAWSETFTTTWECTAPDAAWSTTMEWPGSSPSSSDTTLVCAWGCGLYQAEGQAAPSYQTVTVYFAWENAADGWTEQLVEVGPPHCTN